MNDIQHRTSDELQPFSKGLQREFETAAESIRPILDDAAFQAWCDEVLAIARASFRSWETAGEFLKASPGILAQSNSRQFLAWSSAARGLTSVSATVASAFVLASPRAAETIGVAGLPLWADLGRGLHGDSWKSISLATRFFEESPALMREIPLPVLTTFVQLLGALSARSYDAAAECLDHGARIITAMPPADREAYLALCQQLAGASWKTAQTLFREAPTVMRGVPTPIRPRLITLAGRLVYNQPDDTFAFLKEMVGAISLVDGDQRLAMLDLATTLFSWSWKAAIEFVRTAPAVRRRAGDSGLAAWFDEGLTLLRESVDAGTAYFRLQSIHANAMLAEVSPGVELPAVRDMLRMYSKAISGSDVRVISTEELTERAVGWTDMERPATDGRSIHLPPYLEEFGEKADNLAAYKVFATHQAGHLEFGTFGFDYDRPARVHDDNLRAGDADATGRRGFEAFFDTFGDRKLAKDLFTVAEDFRVDRRIQQEYPGIRRALRDVQAKALAARPAKQRPVREQMVETLIRLSLEARDGLASRSLGDFLAPLIDSEATVEDTAEAVVRLYTFITQVPNIPLDALSQQEAEAIDEEVAAGGFESSDAPREAQPYRGADPVSYRDDLKPELVEAMARAQGQESEGEGQASGMSAEQLQEMLEKSDELSLDGLTQGEVNKSLGMFVTNILREAGQQITKGTPDLKNAQSAGRQPTPERHALSASEPMVFLYDEWDFRANDYRPRWCRLKEQLLKEGSPEFFERILQSRAPLVADIRKQFELLRPEAFKKIKKLQDGEEYDLDAVIEAIVDRRARRTPSDRIYWRKNKGERDVAVAFLLDMSASTDEEIDDRPKVVSYADPTGRYRFDRDRQWHWHWDDADAEPRKRIIDIEKESLVLLIQALETIGDHYGIYGFSGYGRENVEFFVIKDLREGLTDRIKRRVDKIAPVQGTRMGPAIRHCISKLSDVDAKLKLMVLVSDGRPQDHDYGKDRTEKEYAIHDTRMALLEAKRHAIVPFCLTVDRYGHDYLKAMCGDIGYEVVSNIEMLPKRLPALYRRLTT